MEDESDYEYYSDDNQSESDTDEQPDFIKSYEDYSLCNYDNIHKIIDISVKNISKTMILSYTISDTLLKINNWNEGKVYDNHNFIVDENIILIEQKFNCCICYDSYYNGYSLSCNHIFCKNCYQEYLNDKIMDIYSCLKITCPYYKCTHHINKHILSQIMEPKYFAIYDKHVAQNYIIKHNKSMKYCPQINCNIISMGNFYTKSITCICSYEYCFQCHNVNHLPSSCQDYQNWQNNVELSIDNNTWLVANTKKCPKCFTNIEKNEGCNHMTCKNCNYHFCWLCLSDWNIHGYNGVNTTICHEQKKLNQNLLYNQNDVELAKIEINKINYYNSLIEITNKKISLNTNPYLHKFYNFIKYSYVFYIYSRHPSKELLQLNFSIVYDNVDIISKFDSNSDSDNIEKKDLCIRTNKIIDDIIKSL